MSYPYLDIFAPFDIGHTYLKPDARDRFAASLADAGWDPLPFDRLDLDTMFRELNQAYVLGRREPGETRLILFNTGVGLVSHRYEPDPDAPLQDYHRHSREDFRQRYADALRRIRPLRDSLDDDGTVLSRPPTPLDAAPHWTHGVLLGRDQPDDRLGAFSQVGDVETYALGAEDPLRASFGWETTAAAGAAEHVEDVAVLAHVLGYLWEMSYTIENDLAERVAEVDIRPATLHNALETMRQHRFISTTLTEASDVSRLSMTDRFVRMTWKITEQWKFDQIKAGIESKSQLLEQAYRQLLEEKDNAFERRVGLFGLVVALVTSISAAIDVIGLTATSDYVGTPVEDVALRLSLALLLPLVLVGAAVVLVRRA